MSHWPHAPVHLSMRTGLVMVTAGTLRRQPHLSSAERLDFFQQTFFAAADEFGWEIHAWAFLNNHYHWIGCATDRTRPLRRFAGKLHMVTARELNRCDDRPGRKVWFQYWDTVIASQSSYLARLNYVHHNAAKHGIVSNAENYRWCSAAWFAQNATPAFRATVENFKTDALNVPDDF